MDLKAGHMYKTRSGKLATVLTTKRRDRQGFCAVGLIHQLHNDKVAVWQLDGSYISREHSEDNDLLELTLDEQECLKTLKETREYLKHGIAEGIDS